MPDLTTIFTFIIPFLFLLGIVILVHEWGHFIAARLFKVRVEVFSIGMGPRMFGVKRGETDYRVSALPIGGYVKMAGENSMAEVTGAPDEFMSKPRWQRAIILSAGVTMNAILGLVLMFGLLVFQGVPYLAYEDSPVKIEVLPKDSPAAKAGLQPGDRLVELANLNDPTWDQAQDYLARTSDRTFPMVVERDGRRVPVTVQAGEQWRLFDVLGYPPMAAAIDQVFPGMPAERAGLKDADEIVAVDGQLVQTWGEVTDKIRASHGRPLQVTVRRDNQEFTYEVHPEQARRGNAWQVGMLNLSDTRYRKLDVPASARLATVATFSAMTEIVKLVGGLVAGQVSLKQLGGPLEIARQSGRAARKGLGKFVELMWQITLSLAVLNLLPIPILDGGHIVVLGIEGLRRRDLSLAVKERMMQVGLVVLLLIFGFVMYNDVLKISR